MKRIFVCSPLSAPTPEGFHQNQRNAEAYCAWVFRQGFRPFAPHLYYTRFLDDFDPIEREQGIQAGIFDLHECEEIWVFLPVGKPLSRGMRAEVRVALDRGIPVRLLHVNEYADVVGEGKFNEEMLAA